MSVEANSSTFSFSLGGCLRAPVNICLSHKRANPQQTEAERRHWKPTATLWAFANSVRNPAAVMIWTLIGWNDRAVCVQVAVWWFCRVSRVLRGNPVLKRNNYPICPLHPTQRVSDSLLNPSWMHWLMLQKCMQIILQNIFIFAILLTFKHIFLYVKARD